MRILIALFAFACLWSFAVISDAQTADEMPPSEESVCDLYDGAAFGLCNAYCEAMDCDGADPQASDKACNKVLENFMNKFGEPMAPCELVNVCSQEVIDECNEEGKMAETIICNGQLVCSHVIGIRGCSRIGCAIPN